MTQYDPELGWSHRPSSYRKSERTGHLVEYQINSLGLRDDESPYMKPDGLFRVVLLGDSITFGYGVRHQAHFSTLLEAHFENLEVINTGGSGFGIDQELLMLRKEGLRYEPDLVIAYVPHYGGNRHMHAERFSKSKPVFLLEKDDLVLTNWPVPREQAPEEPSALRDLHNRARKLSRLYQQGARALALLTRIRVTTMGGNSS